MKRKHCNHWGICFKGLKAEGVKEYRKYVGGLRKCQKCGWHVGDKSLQKRDKSEAMESIIRKLNEI